MRSRVLVAACALAATVMPASAQTLAGPNPQRIRVSAGVLASASYDVGSRDALFRRNAPGPATTQPFFHTESTLEGAPSFDARVSWSVSPLFAVEVAGGYATPRLSVVVSQDPEIQSTTEIAEEISQYTVDVSGLVQLRFLKLGARARPYAFGGAGYLRQLHEEQLMLETGATGHVGVGLSYWIRGTPASRRGLGVRGEARYVRRWRGIDFEDAARGYPVVSALAFMGF